MPRKHKHDHDEDERKSQNKMIVPPIWCDDCGKNRWVKRFDTMIPCASGRFISIMFLCENCLLPWKSF
jgi:hypothetical protein